MDPTTFMMKVFTTKVSSFAIVKKSCVLSEAGFQMNDYLTNFEAESSNPQFLCNFTFLFFKYWIILTPSLPSSP